MNSRDYLRTTLNPELERLGQDPLTHGQLLDILFDEFGEDLNLPIIDSGYALEPEHILQLGMRLSKDARKAMIMFVRNSKS